MHTTISRLSEINWLQGLQTDAVRDVWPAAQNAATVAFLSKGGQLPLLPFYIAALRIEAIPLPPLDITSSFVSPESIVSYLNEVANCGVRVAVINGAEPGMVEAASKLSKVAIIDTAVTQRLREKWGETYPPVRVAYLLLHDALKGT